MNYIESNLRMFFPVLVCVYITSVWKARKKIVHSITCILILNNEFLSTIFRRKRYFKILDSVTFSYSSYPLRMRNTINLCIKTTLSTSELLNRLRRRWSMVVLMWEKTTEPGKNTILPRSWIEPGRFGEMRVR